MKWIIYAAKSKNLGFKSNSVDRWIRTKKSLEQHTAQQQKNEKSSGELSSAVLLYAHIRLSRNYFLLPHESWIYLCNSIPKKKAELGWSNKSYGEAVFM